MKFEVPVNCGLCASRKQINNDLFICGMPMPKEKEILDISAFKISLNTRPDWCPISNAVDNINSLSGEKRALFDKMCEGFSAMFELINGQKAEDEA
jgi:hypothetical protein